MHYNMYLDYIIQLYFNKDNLKVEIENTNNIIQKSRKSDTPIIYLQYTVNDLEGNFWINLILLLLKT